MFDVINSQIISCAYNLYSPNEMFFVQKLLIDGQYLMVGTARKRKILMPLHILTNQQDAYRFDHLDSEIYGIG